MAYLENGFPLQTLTTPSAHTPGACVRRALESLQPNTLTQGFQLSGLEKPLSLVVAVV